MVGISAYTMNISTYTVKEISIIYQVKPSGNSFSISMIIRFMGLITHPMGCALTFSVSSLIGLFKYIKGRNGESLIKSFLVKQNTFK